MDIAEKTLWSAAVTGVITYGPNLTKTNQERTRTANSWNHLRKRCEDLEICARLPSLRDDRGTSPPADDDSVSEKTATSPDILVGGEHIDTDERAAPMRELPEKLIENINGLKTEKTAKH